MKKGYKDAFIGADKIFWLPTYLTREDPKLAVLTPEDLIMEVGNKEVAEAAELTDNLAGRIQEYLDQGFLVVLMTAGPADEWLREKFV